MICHLDNKIAYFPIQIYMERSRDCAVPDKNFWAPIPIQRVGKEDEDLREDTRENKLKTTSIQIRGLQDKENQGMKEGRCNTENKNSAPPSDNLKVLNYTSLFPRKQRTDLYPEIESRKFLDKHK